jgi:regulator of sirC expression with transglutaminase-like and TPR domain
MQDHSEYKELHALISLLDDPDNHIFEKIQEKIYTYGVDAIPILESAWENAFDNVIQERIDVILHKLQFDSIYSGLKEWANKGYQDLLKGFLLITRHQYPDLDEDKIRRQLQHIKQDIWLEINNDLTSLEKVKVINNILFDIHKFSGNKSNISAPQNSHINTVLETKKGNPLSLGMIYIIISHKLDLPVYGVNLPQHFILAYLNEIMEGSEQIINEKDILFYINPFNKGAIFTRREIDQYIKQLKVKPEKSYYYPCNNRTILQRLISNLLYSYESLGYADKVRELKILGKILK